MGEPKTVAHAAPMLEVCGLESGYGASQVLFGLDLTIGQGEVVTLLGRNGMGKTTTVNAVTGTQPWVRGTIRFRGRAIQSLPPQEIGRAGIALVPEGRRIFPNLTVRENLVAFAANRTGSPEPWTLERVYALFPALAARADNLGNRLSGGEQQMLAIGRALMTNPHLLILDEATEGLAPLLREQIWAVLRAIRESGQTILVIDKYVDRLIELADRHTIIESGHVVWQGTSAQLAAAPEVWRRYMGV